MQGKSKLLIPPAPLASCLAAAIFRDTRGVALGAHDRLNFFPASPLYTLTCVFEGTLHLTTRFQGLGDLQARPPLPQVSVLPPQSRPVVSWSSGPIVALTFGFFPDAWQRIADPSAPVQVPSSLQQPLHDLLRATDVTENWDAFMQKLASVWQQNRATAAFGPWSGSHRIVDWTRHISMQIAQKAIAKSPSTAQRLYQRWVGHSAQSLAFFAKLEELHRLRVEHPEGTPAEIAADGGFSDQSHMGRALKRATGFSPAELNRKIEHEEAFWCYRLLGQRF